MWKGKFEINPWGRPIQAWFKLYWPIKDTTFRQTGFTVGYDDVNDSRTVFNLVLKVIRQLFWFWFYPSLVKFK